MRGTQRASSHGFTLIELMIVVAIIGTLAVLAVFGVRKYVANAKTAEARNSLGQMGKDQSSEFEKESMAAVVLGPGVATAVSRSLCLSPSASVPAAKAQIAGQKYQSDTTAGKDWNLDGAKALTGFACLKFSMDAPQYYMYKFVTANPTSAGGTWKATANGDLNGDGNLSTFELDGVIQPSMTFSLAPNLIETSPDE